MATTALWLQMLGQWFLHPEEVVAEAPAEEVVAEEPAADAPAEGGEE
jgi:hypothetical protein